MASTIYQIATIAIYLCLFFGQLARINLFGQNLPILDLLIVIFSVFNLFFHLLKKEKPTNIFFLIFVILSVFSFILNFQYFSFNSLFYQLRLTSIFLLLAYPPTIKNNQPWLIIALLSNIIFGFIQYFFWPDFSYFKAFNWDPHQYRLVSTFFDPTFTGILYLFFILFLFLNKPKFWQILIGISYLAMSLTYSRSTYLALLIVTLFLEIFYHYRYLFIKTLLILSLTILLLPKVPGESTNLKRTSSIFAKIENYQQAFKLSQKSPFFGLGYNNLKHFHSNPESHASSGFDNSLLTLLITNGILGIIPLLIGLFVWFKSSSTYLKSILIALLIHSSFANSGLYLWVLVYLVLNQTKYRK
ncbi:MAG TPA: O-antigen ligase family protein [Candidatus Woesebacteria bacterium]|nr:O-antigen ligase family protein [Candidatus Woesebacteria bacterium]